MFDDLYYEFEVLLKKLAIRAGKPVEAGKPVDQRLNRDLVIGTCSRTRSAGERTRHRFGRMFGCGLDLEEAKLRSQRLELYACRANDNLDIFTGKADRTAAVIAFDIQVTRRKVEDGLMMGIFKSP